MTSNLKSNYIVMASFGLNDYDDRKKATTKKVNAVVTTF